MSVDYRAGESDLACPVPECRNAAQDGWWISTGEFHYACLAHADAARTADMPDGISDTPPMFQHDAMNPANVPKPRSSDAMAAAMKPAKPAMLMWMRQILLDLGGNEDDVRIMCGAGYRDMGTLSQHAAGWLIAELQNAWLTLRPVGDDD